MPATTLPDNIYSSPEPSYPQLAILSESQIDQLMEEMTNKPREPYVTTSGERNMYELYNEKAYKERANREVRHSLYEQ